DLVAQGETGAAVAVAARIAALHDEAGHHAVEGEAVEVAAPGEVEEGRAHEGRLHDVEVDLDTALLHLEEDARRVHRARRRLVGRERFEVVEGGTRHRLRGGGGGGRRPGAPLDREQRDQGETRIHLHVSLRARQRRGQRFAQARHLQGRELVGGG